MNQTKSPQDIEQRMATWEGRGNAHLQVETKLSAILIQILQLSIFVSKLINAEFELDENVQITLMRTFFDVQGDYRKIGDVILKNLNQNTMEHYGR